MDAVDTAYVKIWGMVAGAVAWDERRRLATFEFAGDFLDQGLDLAPLWMPLETARRGAPRFEFPALARESFLGLPGMLADALPDRFGNAIIDAWLARKGRTAASFSPVERLCYTGSRAVGALEFEPAVQGDFDVSVPVEIGELIQLAQTVVDAREQLRGNVDADGTAALLDIIRVGTSAGGNRPKAVVAINDRTGELRSGQVDAPDGFEHWLLKFDGVQGRMLGDPAGYGRIEFAYSRMARDAGIEMPECRLLEEGDRAHFMTRRFDRPSHGEQSTPFDRLHQQSLFAIAHFDFQQAGAHSYEQTLQVMRELRLAHPDMEQMFRRMVFNVVARNQDDHTKNIAFLMDRDGRWRLSPAFDLTYAYNPTGQWTSAHQMTINGHRDGIDREDLLAVAREASIKRAGAIVDEIVDVVSRWSRYGADAGVERTRIEAVEGSLRLLR